MANNENTNPRYKDHYRQRAHLRVHSEWATKLKALSDETRLKIIHELLKHELSVSQIADNLKLKIYNISRHLKVLEVNGIVSQRKKGPVRLYKISNEARTYTSEDNHVLDLGFCEFKFGLNN
jgi:DNA-binding transcriptional ArsR family regulator